MWYIHTMEYYSATGEKRMLFAATWTQVEIIPLHAVDQKEKDKDHMMTFTYGI